MSMRLLAVIAEISLGTLLIGWGVTTACRPSCWTSRGAQWWVGWSRTPVGRTHGAAVALVGVGLLVSAIATALTAPAAAISVLARDVQMAGLGVLLLAGALLAATHPSPADDAGDDSAIGPDPEPLRSPVPTLLVPG